MFKDILQISKAVCAAIIFCLVYSLIFAGLLSLFSIPSTAIKPVNQVAKILSIVFGGMLFIRGERGLVKGAALGVLSILQAWLLFATIAGDFSANWTLLLEVLIGAFAGAITGIIAVNVKKA